MFGLRIAIVTLSGATAKIESTPFDPCLTNRQILAEVNETCEIAWRHPTKFMLAAQERRRNERRHGERIRQAEADRFDAAAHCLVHRQYGARKRSILQPKTAVRTYHLSALQHEAFRSACCWRRRVGDQHEPIVPRGGEGDAKTGRMNMMAVCNDAYSYPPQ